METEISPFLVRKLTLKKVEYGQTDFLTLSLRIGRTAHLSTGRVGPPAASTLVSVKLCCFAQCGFESHLEVTHQSGKSLCCPGEGWEGLQGDQYAHGAHSTGKGGLQWEEAPSLRQP